MNDPSTHGFHILSRAVVSWSGSAVIHYHSTNFHGVSKPSSGPGPDRQQLSVHIPSLSFGLEEDLLTRTPNCESTLDFSGAPSFLILVSSAHQVHTRKLTRLLVPLFQEFRLEEELRQVHQYLNIRRVIRGTNKVINRVGKIPYILPAPKPES